MPGGRVPVQVLIRDARGNPVPWVSLSPDASIRNRYAIYSSSETDEIIGRTEEGIKPGTPATRTHKGYKVLVVILQGKEAYNIDARLFHGSKAVDSKPLKTMVESDIKKDAVSERVNFIIRSLLDERL
jgi:hypothetical protein